ncbi:SLC13 family permease [Thioalkalivibrio thiocyanoxidans]|uniref:SLC13 family permease n=1 Tax=Thioalkalivibrio thiocyanoxidans TaxID=152475 RepID=UPI00035C3857|nr:SLC13 family permease [Thioalkalivibrio thiocyanoxidans]
MSEEPRSESKDDPGDSAAPNTLDWRRWSILAAGLAVFFLFWFMDAPAPAVDPAGEEFPLSDAGKAALGLFLLAAIWWVFTPIPIGVTAIAIGVFQALFLIRPPEVAFGNFMDPAVWFIFASLVIGIAFTKSGLTQRLAYRMLMLVGERTSTIYLGTFLVTVALTLVMAHTAVAATIFPVLLAIYSLYDAGDRPTRFGKGLFIGMAFAAGAGSIITLLGSARGIVGISFARDVADIDVGFFEVTYYLAPVGLLMTVLIWWMMLIFFPPEKKRIEGLTEVAERRYRELGAMKRDEWLTILIVVGAVLVLALQAMVPALEPVSRPAILLVTTLLFFALGVLTLKELEEIPWNIILLFGGAMSIGFCLWQTGAAEWLAITWLGMFEGAHWLLFVLGLGLFFVVMTNVIMNVAAIAIVLPVALVMAGYMGVSPHVVLFVALVATGMPFLFLVGAAPNAIAYQSGQFSTWEFFRTGVPASIVLTVVIGFSVLVIWPLLGMPILAG